MPERRIVTRRRNNAPIRPPRPARVPALASLAMASSVGFLTMGATLGLASVGGGDLTAGEAGPGLARLLALSAVVAGICGTLVAVLLAGESRAILLGPAVIIGVVAGGLEAVFLFIPVTGPAIALPALLVVFALPVFTRHIWKPREGGYR